MAETPSPNVSTMTETTPIRGGGTGRPHANNAGLPKGTVFEN